MSLHQNYMQILQEELLLAMGCTEPIAIAYAAAIARFTLKEDIVKLKVSCSGNVVKNVKGVVVPNTGGLRGMTAAAVAGVVVGDHEKKLEVISEATEEQIAKIQLLANSDFCEVSCLYGEANLNIIAEAFSLHHHTMVQIMHTHTNVIIVKRDDAILYEKPCDTKDFNSVLIDRSCLNVKDIYEFAINGDFTEVKELLRSQASHNYAIADEGIKNNYGANVGKVILEFCSDQYHQCIAYASAASDARMGGCKLAVMTNSGSGNQGITTSLPIVMFAKLQKIEEDKMLRALLLSNLLTIHIKTGIGRLSAYCGVSCAAAGSFAGIAYLEGHGLDIISAMVINHLGTVSGMICDGAKESCASKISTALFSAMLGYQMALQKQSFGDGCGIIHSDLERTIDTIGHLGREGMRETDNVILSIMTK